MARTATSPSALWKQFELQVSLLLEESRRQGGLPAYLERATPASKKSSGLGSLASKIDHTLLKPDATRDEILALCAQALEHGFATVCVQSQWIPEVAPVLRKSRRSPAVKPIAVVGFPHGACLTAAKATETSLAVRAGAQEIDMVLNVGRLKSRDFQFVLDDIRAVVRAARVKSKKIPVKVILETSLLSDAEKVVGAVLSELAGAAFVKTSTGFGGGGATIQDIKLLRSVCSPRVKIKASGGIRTREIAESMLQAGADRLGASASVSIVTESRPEKMTPTPAQGGY